jgi:hypothetical protein
MNPTTLEVGTMDGCPWHSAEDDIHESKATGTQQYVSVARRTQCSFSANRGKFITQGP